MHLALEVLTRIHFTAKQCRFTSHRRQKQEIMTHLEAETRSVCMSFIPVISAFAPVIGETWPEMTQQSRSTPTWTRRHTNKRAALSSKYRSLRNNKKVFSNYWAFSNRSRHFPTIQSRPYGSPYRSGNALLLFLVFS